MKLVTEEPDEHELHKVLRGMRYDLTALQAKVTDALNMLAYIDLPDGRRVPCPTCRLTFKGDISLAEHAYHQHDGPVPAHWLEAEARTAKEPA